MGETPSTELRAAISMFAPAAKVTTPAPSAQASKQALEEEKSKAIPNELIPGHKTQTATIKKDITQSLNFSRSEPNS